MKLFKSKSKKESIKNLIREFFNSRECSLNHGTDKIESDIESLKVRVHRLECSSSSANNVDTFAGKTKNELNDCIKDYDLKISRMLAIAFENSAEWQSNQSPWISVKEKAGCDSSNDCIVMDSDGEVFRACFIRNKWLKYNRGYYVIDNVTHWMPIPSFDEILEANRDVLERIKEKEVNHG